MTIEEVKLAFSFIRVEAIDQERKAIVLANTHHMKVTPNFPSKEEVDELEKLVFEALEKRTEQRKDPTNEPVTGKS